MKRRRPSTFGRHCVRCWFSHQGRIVRMLHVNDYRPCESGGEPILLVKLLSHARYARGLQLDNADWWGSVVLPHLVPGQWVELAIAHEGATA